METFEISDEELIRRECAKWSAYAVIFGVDENPDGSIDYITSDEPESPRLPNLPYPTSGVNIGLLTGKLDIDPGSNLQDGLPLASTGLPRAEDARILYKRILQFSAFASARKEADDIANGATSITATRSSGGSELTTRIFKNVLVCLCNRNSGDRFPTQFKMILNRNCINIPSKDTYDGDLTVLNFNVHSYSDLDVTSTVATGSWVNFFLQNDGTEVYWDSEGIAWPIDPNTSNRAYPAINMSNML